MVADLEQMHHVARLAFLAMSARAVGAAEMQSDPAIKSMVVTVYAESGEDAIEVEFRADNGMAIGGMSI